MYSIGKGMTQNKNQEDRENLTTLKHEIVEDRENLTTLKHEIVEDRENLTTL
jgi:hypothetical protein